MKLVKLAAAVLNQTPLDWDGNAQRISQAIDAARQQGASILCLPELCITGYGCEDAFQSPGLQQMARDMLSRIAPQTAGMAVSLGLPWMHGGGLFNVACMIVDGRVVGLVAKQNLAGDGLHYEPRWFKPWPRNVTASTSWEGQSIPLGDLIFECDGVRIGMEICEDAWVGHRPGADLAEREVDIILNPSASHFAFGKQAIRQRFVLEGSRAFHVSYVYANLLGNEAGRAVYDGDAMIATGGRLVAVGPRFSFHDVLVTSAVVDVDATRMLRSRSGSFQPRVERLTEGVVDAPLPLPQQDYAIEPLASADWERSSDLKEEEFTRAVSLALFDYLRKARARGFVVSLSGGADSAAVACLAAIQARLGVRELGWDGYVAKLSHIPEVSQLRASGDGACGELIKRLLTTVYQATANSSQTTRSAAAAVATELGADHLELDIESVVQSYVGMVEQAIDSEVNWENADMALQNIQARVRAPSVWMIANLRAALLLATSNRSEAAVGYTTMDGDTCGGISPIAGIDKNFLRHWLRWLESDGPLGSGPFPALQAVNKQQPTAELRPAEFGQTDEGDLMPYDVLDAIERLAIRDKMSPREVYRALRAQRDDIGSERMLAYVVRFFRLWSRNQWKRERFAPSFHLDDENLDPKTWCRFPILSGGFERELADLEREVARSAETDPGATGSS